MGEGDGPWAKIECGSRPWTFLEIAAQEGVGIKELSELDNVVHIELGGEKVERDC